MSEEIYINTGTSFQQQYTARQPAIGTAPITAQYDAQGNASSQTPFTYTARTPYTFRSPVNAQTPYIANGQQPYPYIANNQTPYPASAQQPYPYPANAQQPYPYIANGQQPYPYIANSQTPFTYQHQNPFTYPRANIQGQTPFTYQHQNPFTYPRSNIQGQTPFTYQHRSPFTYPVSNTQKQNPYIANGQQPFPYIAISFSQAPYGYQQPLGANIPVNSTDHASTTAPDVVSITGQALNTPGFEAERVIGAQVKTVFTNHSNGYSYAYFYVRMYVPALMLRMPQSQAYFYGQTAGTINLNTDNQYRLMEVVTFGNGSTTIIPDTVKALSVGDAGLATSGAGSIGQGTSVERTLTTPYNVHFCDMGYVQQASTQRSTQVVPTFVKTGYPNYTTPHGAHSITVASYASCNWGCFPAGSKVLLEDNTTKNIEDMQVGDKVIGQDGVVNEVKTVMTPTFTDKAIYTINGSFEITGGHPVLTSGGAWKSCNASDGQEMHPELNITELAIGDILVKDAGNANGDTVNEEITSLTVRTEAEVTVYNLDVTDSPTGNDTYVVDNYIVHNK